MTDFDRQHTIDDLNALREVVAQFYGSLRPDDWQRKTGERSKDWTLAETLAHIVIVAAAFNGCVLAGKRGESVNVGTLQQREDLRGWNTRSIADRLAAHTTADLQAQLKKHLNRAARYAGSLTDGELANHTFLPVYNRPAPVSHFIEWQLSHIAVVHGAQVTRAVDQPPIWERFSEAVQGRLVSRFVRHLSWAYWHTLAPDLHVIYHFHVDGAAGGDWTLAAMPDGGYAGEGAPPKADYILSFTEPGVLFSLFTGNESFPTALERGELRIVGDAKQALNTIRLFSATPPRGWAA